MLSGSDIIYYYLNAISSTASKQKKIKERGNRVNRNDNQGPIRSEQKSLESSYTLV